MATKIEFRFLFDIDFFEDIIKNKNNIFADIAYKLSYITSKATHNKKKQNIISEKSRENLVKNNPKLSMESIRIFLNRLDDTPSIIENEEDETIKNLRLAVYLTYFYPNKVMIFTTNDKLDEYKRNPHYHEIDTIKFIYGDDAVKLIEFWFKRCRTEGSSY